MKQTPDDDLLAKLFEVWSHEERGETDFNELADLSEGPLPPEGDAKWEQIATIDPELGRALSALREFHHEESDKSPPREKRDEELIAVLSEARKRASICIGFEKEKQHRIAYRGSSIRIHPWIETVFGIGKQMLGSDEMGIWPTDEISLSIPVGDTEIRAVIRGNDSEMDLKLLVEEKGKNSQTDTKVNIEYWRGAHWIGEDRLWAENRELSIRMLPGWPYLIAIHAPEAMVLKVICHPAEFSATERRMAALLRCLAGDISGSFRLVREGWVPPTQEFLWSMSMMSRCLPQEARLTGYAAVRDAASEEVSQANVQDLFHNLALEWLSSKGQELDSGSVLTVLQESDDPLASGFVQALERNYSDALSIWKSEKERINQDPHILAGCLLAGVLCGQPIAIEGDVAFPKKGIERVVNCVGLLENLGKETGEEHHRLAEILRSISY